MAKQKVSEAKLRLIRAKLRNCPEKHEYYLALQDYPTLPLSPRAETQEQLVGIMEYHLQVAENGEVLEVEE
jgi:hypothetical protein